MEKTLKHLFLVCVLLFSLSLYTAEVHVIGGLAGLGLDREDVKAECIPLPKPKPPSEMSGGEGIPPMPLPAVPQRRTEKKNPPRPPVLVVKIITDKGESDWNTNPSDIDNLLKWMNEQFNISFSSSNMTLYDVFRIERQRVLSLK